MFGTLVAERRNDIMIGMMIFESAFFTDPSGFRVSVIVSAPYCIKLKDIETS